jgi:hypothetical protein
LTRDFACVVAAISPEFVSSLFGHCAQGSLIRYAAGVGMIGGLYLESLSRAAVATAPAFAAADWSNFAAFST